MWEEMWENGSKNQLFIYKIQYLMRQFGTSPATIHSPTAFTPMASAVPGAPLGSPAASLVLCDESLRVPRSGCHGSDIFSGDAAKP